MDPRANLRDFLITCRARINPEDIGLASYGRRPRRVAGLRREEVARLAGVSVDYYIRFERGAAATVSAAVLDAFARALQLDEREHAHLIHLVQALSDGGRPTRRDKPAQIRPGLRRLLDAMTDVAAFITNSRMDVVASNELALALYQGWRYQTTEHANQARFVFLDPRAHEFFVDWAKAACETVGILRSCADRHPFDRDLSDLVGELSVRGETFRLLWAEHSVRFPYHGTRSLRHPAVGEFNLGYEIIPLSSDDGLTLVTYSADAGSADHDALRLISAWAATGAVASLLELGS